MDDHYIDAQLNIQTQEQKGFTQNIHYHRYEPTSYYCLDQLFQSYKINRDDHVVDFGCGKGRLNFYIHYLFQAHVTGVEMDEKLYQIALENHHRYVKKMKSGAEEIKFYHGVAEKYPIAPEENIFYFFNPFTVPIFMKVVNRIIRSVEKKPRKIDIILYYPSAEYIFYLENHTPFILMEEIQVANFYERFSNERFLVYRLEI